MKSAFDIRSLHAVLREWRGEGSSTALVPTMGNLHEGHMSLLQHAREIADRTIVSIFVNPIQFGHGEDYEHYPSTLGDDSAKLEAAGLDLVFAPDLRELYPGGTAEDTRVSVPALSDILCGRFRPGHFAGVATVVAKLLINVQPDYALFGEKDYQQLLVIRRMVHDLLIPVEIVGMPIIREPNGLAMSSRNAYLDAGQRKIASKIYATLTEAAAAVKARPGDFEELEQAFYDQLEAYGMRPEYFSVRRREDLMAPRRGDTELKILVAAWLGEARLIDNISVELDQVLR